MNKNSIISFRIKSDVREALKARADEEHRSLSSLLEIIIENYITHQYDTSPKGDDRRRFPRRSFNSPALVESGAGTDRKCYLAGTVQDISLNGMRLSFPYGEPVNFLRSNANGKFEIVLRIPGAQRPVNFTCQVQRVEDTGDDFHVGAQIKNAEFQSYQALQQYMV